MVFKTVDGQLTNIFSKVEKINSGFDLTGNKIQEIVDDFNKYNSEQSFGEDYTAFLNEMSNKNLNVASMFEEIAKQGTSAKASIQGVYAAILDGNTKGISNIKSVISAFNQIDPTNQQAFANAVGQSNAQLGSYLGGLNGAKASMLGYATETTIATAKTIALRAATMALNVALSWGLSVVISGVIKLAQEAITTQKELAEQAKESADEVNSQTKALEDLKKKYKEICDSTDDEKTKNEQLDEIKQELINIYKIEKDNLAELNLEREKGLDLLDQEFEKNNRNARNNWLDKNEKAIQKSREKMALSGTDYFSTYLSKDNISESILKLFDKKEAFGDTGYVNLEFDYADTVERLEKLKNVYNEILNIKSKRKLTDDEEQLLSEVKSTLNSVQKIYDENYDFYSTAAQYETPNLIENYIKTDTGKLENVGKETFQAWRKGLIEQATNEEERRNIQKYIEQQFPDFTEYFKNLDLAKSMFNISDNPTNGFDAGKKSFIEGLSDDDLKIAMQIPDLFAEGLSKASEKIAEFKADPNNVVTLTFDYSEYSEQVDDIVKNVDKVQTALDKLNGGKTIDSKDITELANAFPDYSTKILSAANDTEKLKSVLREIKSDAPRSLINTLTNLKDLSKEDQEAVNGLINVLSSLNSVSPTYSDVLADLETKQSLLSTAYKEMHDDGEVSVGTYQKLIDSGLNYSEAIDIANGKISVNVEKLKELAKEKAKDEILTLRLTKAELEHNIALNPKDSSLYEEKIRAIDEEIEANQKALELLEGYDYTTTAKKDKEEKPQSVTDFEAEYARRQHEINMGRMKEDEDYYSWLLEAAHTAYDGLKDYESDLWKYEEEVYKGRKQLADDFYDEQQKDFEDRISALEDDIDKAKDGKFPSLIDQSDIDALNEFNQTMQKTYGLGNVDLTKRPKVNAETMRKAGYEADDDERATVYSSFNFMWQSDKENGKYVAVHYTPILPDGTVLDEKSLDEYIRTLVDTDDIIKADTKGIILKVDTDLDISEADIKSLETDNPTENIQNIIKACDDWGVALHEVQADWLKLDDAVNNVPAMRIEDKFDYIRSAYQEIINEIDGRINEIVQGGVEGHEDDLKALEKEREQYVQKIADVFDLEIESEEKYINSLKDKNDEYYDDKIKKLKDEKSEMEKRYDAEIKKIDETIDSLQNENDEKKRANDIEKARQELENASKRTRQVYGADGTISYKQDDTKIKEAQSNLDDLMFEQIIDIIKDNKDTLNKEKDTKSDDYDNQIDVLTKQKETQDNIYDTLLKILDKYKDPDVTESNSNVWKTIGKDNENAKITDKSITVKGTEIDTTSINGDKSKTDNKTDNKADNKDKTTADSKKVFAEFLKSLGMTEPNIKKYINGEFKNALNGLMGIRQTASFTPKVDKGLSVEWGTLTRKEMGGNVSFNGDIVIQNPVGNSDDLAKELALNLPNAFQKQMYTNLKK